MARILQIRRGTAAQNDKFTGLAGEITFDTDTKTLRIHDGVKLGGYSLLRADQLGDGTGGDNGSDNNGAFDINTVPSEFWQNIVATYAPAGGPQIFESRTLPIGNVAYAEYIWNAGTSAKLVQTVLICQTPEADYAIGDTVAAFGIGARANPAPITFLGTNGLHVRLHIGGDAFWVCHKSTGIKTNVSNDRWALKFIIWY
ncbi:hypothetical protein HDR63_03175 [bacterium]|nr:hypothetical protein [bacterium]